jgi:hypothetical protein
MTVPLVALVVGLLAVACGPSGSPIPSPSPMCRTGCPCGRSCISCELTCHVGRGLEGDDAGDVDADPAQ